MGGRARARVERGERGGDLGRWRGSLLVVLVVVGDSGCGEGVVMSVVSVARAGAERVLVLLGVVDVVVAAFLWAVRVEAAAVGLVILFWAPKARVPWVWEERVAAVLRGFLGGMV